MKRKAEDLTGQKFGKLTVLKRAEDKIYKNGEKRPCYLCQCDCGNKKEVVAHNLKSGNIKSCGCLKNENRKRKFKNNFFELKDAYIIGYDSKKENKFFIDTEDFDKIKKYYWRKNCNGYWESVITENNKIKHLKLHRVIQNIKDPKIYIDHINHNKNDNRKCNLRICSAAENVLNKSHMSNNTSGTIGVYYKKSANRWIAEIQRYKIFFRKSFKTKEEAIEQRKKWEEELFGEFSYDNSVNICNDIEQEIENQEIEDQKNNTKEIKK